MKRGDLGYWAWRAKVGAPKKIPSPETLWEVACEYFQMRDESPYEKPDFIKGGDRAGEVIKLEYPEPYTWEGFEDYLNEKGIISKLDDYRSNKDGRYSEYADIITHIGKIMYDQKFRGAALGVFKENLIGRYLGLTDKTQSTIIQEQPLFPDED